MGMKWQTAWQLRPVNRPLANVAQTGTPSLIGYMTQVILCGCKPKERLRYFRCTVRSLLTIFEVLTQMAGHVFPRPSR